MATLQNIRNRAGLLISIVIGLALLAFILTDLLTAGDSLFRSNQYEIGKVNGNSIKYPEFQAKVEQMTEIYKMNYGQTQITDQIQNQIQDQAWSEYVRNEIMTGIYENLGIDVSSDELFEMVQGSNIHPMIQQLFTNPETGQFDKSVVINFLKYIDVQGTPEQRAYWSFLQNQLLTDRKYSKYISLLGQGLYISNNEVEQQMANHETSANIQFIALPFGSVADSTVTVTDKELKDYYNKNKDQYSQEAVRTVQYVSFPVEATEEDDKNALKWIEEIKADFVSAENNAQFISVNSDVQFEDIFQKKDDFIDEYLADFAFGEEPGSVYGPYKDGNAYKIAKLDARKNLPDSVQARHILLNPNDIGYDKIEHLADSLKQLIEKGANFANLAKEFSADRGSSIVGGDLGWFERGRMVKPFEDACFNGKEKEVYIVPSQFGLHVIQLMKKGKEVSQARLAILVRNIEPGTQTFQQVYAKASQFASQSPSIDTFNESVKSQDLTKRTASLSKNDISFMGMEQSRQLVRAAWKAKKPGILVNNEGSSIFELENTFIVASLVSIQDEGVSVFEQVRFQVELNVKQEAKAKVLIEKMNNATASNNDILLIASTLDTDVNEANDVNLGTFNIPSLGFEPIVVGAISAMSDNELSKPLKGRTGVYLVKVISTTYNKTDNIDLEKTRLRQSAIYQANYTAFEALRDAAEIEDNRIKFY